ncbi:MAG: LamG domain-containing protein [Planctomycetota bacterium]|nr:MAG: LamG domain-containing protein [Planctomycetota bacterium]
MESKRGLALILVVVVISALVVVAAPFALSMRLDRRSSLRFSTQIEAQLLAQAAANYAIAKLYLTHPSVEKYFQQQEIKQNPNTLASLPPQLNPSFDPPSEWKIQLPPKIGKDIVLLQDGRRLQGLLLKETPTTVYLQVKSQTHSIPKSHILQLIHATIETQNSKGTMLALTVEDEQGKIDLNTAPPRVLGNLLGSTQLVSNISPQDTTIPIQDPTPFYSDGNPNTIDGILYLNGEFIAYRHIQIVQAQLPDGSSTKTPAFTGCLRGLFLSNLFPKRDPQTNQLVPNMEHNAGDYLYDARAWKIAYHTTWIQPGNFLPFESVSQIREIANWPILELIVELLKSQGITQTTLESLGITNQTLQRARLFMEAFKENTTPYTSEEKELLQQLAKAGLKVQEWEEVFGRKRVKNYLQQLQKKIDKYGQEWLQTWLKKLQSSTSPNNFLQKLNTVIRTRKEFYQKNLPQALNTMAKYLDNIQKYNFDPETLGMIELQRLKKYLTVHAHHQQLWSDPVPLLFEAYASNGFASSLRLPYVPGACAGTIVKIQPKNQKPLFRRCYWISSRYTSAAAYRRTSFTSSIPNETRVFIFPPTYLNLTTEDSVSLLLRPRININSAPWYVLRAVLAGLQKKGSKNRITVPEAEEMASIILQAQKNGISSFSQLSDLLNQARNSSTSKNFTKEDIDLALINAISPSNQRLRYSSFGFCFQSQNVFRITTTALIHSPASTPLAYASLQKTVRIAPPTQLTRIWDSQQDFLSHLPYLNSPQFPLHFEGKKLRNLDALGNSPYAFHPPYFPANLPGKSGLRLKEHRIVDSKHFTEHFDATNYWNLGGKLLDNETLEIPTASQIGGLRGLPLVQVKVKNQKAAIALPARLEFWVKPTRPPQGKAILFNLGNEEYNGRIVLYYQSQTRKLVLEVFDDTLQQTPARAEAPLPLQTNQWYHISASWHGGQPDQLQLCVDGQPYLSPTKGVSYLTQNLDANSYTLTVQNTYGFPPQGTIQIGEEVCDYVRLRGNQIELKTTWNIDDSTNPPTIKKVRASRFGKTTHQIGEPVRLYGYALPLSQKLYVGKASLYTELKTPTPQLHLTLQPAYNKPSSPPPTPLEPQDTTLTISTKEYKINEQQTLLLPTPWRYLPDSTKKYPKGTLELKYTIADFPREGYLFLEGEVQNQPNSPPTAGGEVVYYTGHSGNTFHNLQRGLEGTTPKRFVRLRSIRLISIRLSNASEYPTSGKIQLYHPTHPEWITYRKPKNPQTQAQQHTLLIGSLNLTNPDKPIFTESRDFGDYAFHLFQQTTYSPKTPVMPVYSERVSSILGQGDKITLYDWTPTPQNNVRRVQMQISRAIGAEYAFTSHLPHPYNPFTETFTWILKWPTGLLPLYVPENMYIAGRGKTNSSTPNTAWTHFPGIYDEIRFEQLSNYEIMLGPTLFLSTKNSQFRYRNSRTPVALKLSQNIQTSSTSLPLPSSGRWNYLQNLRRQFQNLRSSPKPNNPKQIRQLQRQIRQLQRQIQRLEREFQKDFSKKNILFLLRAYKKWYLNNNPFLLQQILKIQAGGLLRLGNEILFTEGLDFRNNRLKNCRRGLFHTTPQNWGKNTPIHILEYPTTGVVSKSPYQLTIRTGMNKNLLPKSGYLMVFSPSNQRHCIVAYKNLAQTWYAGLTLKRFLDRKGQPILNNCYGTPPYPFQNGDLAYFLPFRYYDHFEPLGNPLSGGVKDSEDLAFFQATLRAPRAFFQRIWWEVIPTPHTLVRLFVRLDGKPSWQEIPTRSRSQAKRKNYLLYEFRNPKKSLIQKSGDEIQFRLYIQFKPSAYRQGGWKETPIIRRIGIDYLQKTQILYVQKGP